MDKYVVVRIKTYTGSDYPTLASSLLFSSREIAEEHAKRDSQLFYAPDRRWEVYQLTEPITVVQPTEADTQSVV